MMLTILTADELMDFGLGAIGWDAPNQARKSRSARIEMFNKMYGSHPTVYANMWEDLIEAGTLGEHDRSITGLRELFRALFFLRHYGTVEVIAGFFNVSFKLAKGDVLWHWVYNIQSLKERKIKWIDRWSDPNSEIYTVTVDGVHFTINEPKHPTMSKNPKYYSHKNRCAGLNYEIGIAVHEQKVVWLPPGGRAGRNDMAIYNQAGGLKEKLQSMAPGKKAICDQGYKGEAGRTCATASSRDSLALRTFKSRMRARHETFNGRIKNFKILSGRFRHRLGKHRPAFEACCIIVQYQMDNGFPLFS